jgi:Flp pilus assembly pilin Flp
VKALRGQTGVEYGLLIATIAVVTLLGASAFGSTIRQWFDLLVSRITTNS